MESPPTFYDLSRQTKILTHHNILNQRIEELEEKKISSINSFQNNQRDYKALINKSQTILSILKYYPTGFDNVDSKIIRLVNGFNDLDKNIDSFSPKNECTNNVITLLSIIQKEISCLLNKQSQITISKLLQVEKEITNILYYAEDEGIIPSIDEKNSWKALIKHH